jgi:hypothetical protein
MSTTEPEPMTGPQIKAALESLAPFPPEDQPVAALALAKNMAVAAQRRWRRNLSRYFSGRDAVTQRAFHESVGAMCDEFAALHLLMALADENPVRAGELATQIRDAWNDGFEIGEWLREHELALGVDTDAVNRLEDAWQALPDNALGAKTEATP